MVYLQNYISSKQLIKHKLPNDIEGVCIYFRFEWRINGLSSELYFQ